MDREINSVEAEMAVLGAMLASRQAIDSVGVSLTGQDFTKPANGKVFDAIVACASKTERPSDDIDFILLHEELKGRGQLRSVGGDDYLIKLAEYAPLAANALNYANLVKDKAIERKLASSAGDIRKLLDDPERSTEEKVEAAREMLEAIQTRRSQDTVKTIAAVAQEYLDEIEAVRERGVPISGRQVGFSSIDNFTGGFGDSDLIVVAARPAMGKTALAMNIAQNVARRDRRPVLVFSLEMQAKQLFKRCVATITGLPTNILQRQVPNGAIYEQLREAIDQMFPLPILFEDQSDQNIRSIRDKARKINRETGGLSMIVVDYLQLVTGDRRDNRTQEVGEVARGLKNLAKEMGCPVIALAQLSREVEKRADKRPMLSDLRESGSIEAEADIVAFIYRDAYYNRSEEEGPEDDSRVEEAEIIFAKNRNGSTGTVVLGFQPAYTRFREFDRRRIEGYNRPAPSVQSDVERDRAAYATSSMFED